MELKHVRQIINKQSYDTRTATLLTSDVYWDGHNFERSNRNRWLLRSPGGAYLLRTQTQWQGERDTLEIIDAEQAIQLYERPLSEHEVSYQEAFPDVQVTEG